MTQSCSVQSKKRRAELDCGSVELELSELELSMMLELLCGCFEPDDFFSELEDLGTDFELLEDFCSLLDDDVLEVGAALDDVISTLFEK